MDKTTRLLLTSIALIFVQFLTACSVIDEGETDYARTLPNSATKNTSDSINCDLAEIMASNIVPTGIARGCYELLFRKYSASEPIKKGDTVSIHLMQAFITGLKERRTPVETFRGLGSNAEIVVFANICEQGVDDCSITYGPQSDKSGRVIYYSNGVKANQYLNFSYLPVYGPMKYAGGPLVIQISIIELDFASEQEREIYQLLANAGKKAYPPASPVLGLLDNLGQAILAANNDDIAFRYSMTLAPEGGDQSVKYPALSVGNFVLLKKPTFAGPQEADPWTGIRIDNNTGRLAKICEQPKDTSPITTVKERKPHKKTTNPDKACIYDLLSGQYIKDYRENSYLTFQIQSGFSDAEFSAIQTLGELQKELKNAGSESLANIKTSIQSLTQELERNSVESQLSNSLIRIERKISKSVIENLPDFAATAITFADNYNTALLDHSSNCQTATPKCSNSASSDFLKSFTFDVRALIASKKPKVEIDTIVPTFKPPQSKLPNNDGFVNALIDIYKSNAQSAAFEKIIAKIQIAENAWVYANSLALNKNHSETELAKSAMKDVVVDIIDSIRLFKTLQCGSPPIPDACYAIPNREQYSIIFLDLIPIARSMSVKSSEFNISKLDEGIEDANRAAVINSI